MAGLRSFLIELRRRRVFRVAALYGAVAWLLIQVAATTFPLFDLPAWSVRGVVLLTVLGFPVAMLLAWAFDLRPGHESAAALALGDAAVSPWRSGSLWLGLAAGLLLGVGAYRGWQEFAAPPQRPGIAVLSFDALGESGNAAGVVEYCMKNNFLGSDAGGVKDQLMSKVSGGGEKDKTDYADGAKGLLKTGDGKSVDIGQLGSMKQSVTKNACASVLDHAKSLL